MSSNSNSNNETRTSSSIHFSNGNSPSSHEEAAAAAVAHLQSIANSFATQKMVSSEAKKPQARTSSSRPSVQSTKSSSGTKRKAADADADDDEEDNDSGGYNSDDEGGMAASRSAVALGEAMLSASRAAPDAASSSAGAAAMAASKQAAVGQASQQQVATAVAAAVPQQLPTANAMAAPMLPPQPLARDATSTGDPATAMALAALASTHDAASRGDSGEDDSDLHQPSKKKSKKVLEESKREERNAREKERSFRISKQINELRNLLSSGGVIVPKGTKSAVLTEAANYIRMLQQHQYKSEIDRHQLVQQMQIIGNGALGPQAATAVRHVAAQNGVWSLGNFGGVPPRSAMTYYQQGAYGSPGPATASMDGSQPQQTPSPMPQPQPQQETKPDPQLVSKIDDHEYRYVFNSCSVGMAIASMGGAFIDCNSLFCQLSQYSKQEVCAMTIFNLTSRQDLQHAFDLISKMISPPPDGSANQVPPPCVLRGAMKHRNDLGLSIALIKGEDGIAKCFCVTLIKNPASPFDTSRPIPATVDFLQPGSMQLASLSEEAQKGQSSGSLSSPAYTTG
uniref:BHLH domain-containing protein n=1 Tax=Odontella aurita TaxID=265563 RepID=A0A7S4JQB3_9STRA